MAPCVPLGAVRAAGGLANACAHAMCHAAICLCMQVLFNDEDFAVFKECLMNASGLRCAHGPPSTAASGRHTRAAARAVTLPSLLPPPPLRMPLRNFHQFTNQLSMWCISILLTSIEDLHKAFKELVASTLVGKGMSVEEAEAAAPSDPYVAAVSDVAVLEQLAQVGA